MAVARFDALADESHARVTGVVARHERTLMRIARQASLCHDDALDAYQRALEIFVRRVKTVAPRNRGGGARTSRFHCSPAVGSSRRAAVADSRSTPLRSRSCTSSPRPTGPRRTQHEPVHVGRTPARSASASTVDIVEAVPGTSSNGNAERCASCSRTTRGAQLADWLHVAPRPRVALEGGVARRRARLARRRRRDRRERPDRQARRISRCSRTPTRAIRARRSRRSSAPVGPSPTTRATSTPARAARTTRRCRSDDRADRGRSRRGREHRARARQRPQPARRHRPGRRDQRGQTRRRRR